MFKLMYMASINSLHGMPMWHSIYLFIDCSKVEGKLVIIVQTFARGIFK